MKMDKRAQKPDLGLVRALADCTHLAERLKPHPFLNTDAAPVRGQVI
jgi:hypothetical protein